MGRGKFRPRPSKTSLYIPAAIAKPLAGVGWGVGGNSRILCGVPVRFGLPLMVAVIGGRNTPVFGPLVELYRQAGEKRPGFTTRTTSK